MKIDLFDAMTWALFGIVAVIAAVEAWTWTRDAVREHLRRRRLRRLDIEEKRLPRPNAGFRLEAPSSAARRHFERDQERLLIQHPWSSNHQSPRSDAGSRHLREPD